MRLHVTGAKIHLPAFIQLYEKVNLETIWLFKWISFSLFFFHFLYNEEVLWNLKQSLWGQCEQEEYFIQHLFECN